MTLLLALSLTLGCKDGTSTDTSPVDVDADGDGIPASEDCNDEDVSGNSDDDVVVDDNNHLCDIVIRPREEATFAEARRPKDKPVAVVFL